MKILFIWRKYDRIVGGVERMSVALMNEMIRRGHSVSLLSWDRKDATSYYEMSPEITWVKLDTGDSDKRAGWTLRIQRALKIREIIKGLNPDVAIAFMDGVFLSAKISVLGLGIPVVEAERCSVARFEYLKSGRYLGLIFQSLRLARRITIQLESYRKDYPAFLRSKIVTISNPVFPARDHAKPKGEGGSDKILLSVGRLSYQKNYQVLVKAFAELAGEFPSWTLMIVGGGEDQESLKSLISDLKIQSRVQLVDPVKDVTPYYCKAQLFCLPSRWEGFPNALAEALAHGLPSVGFAGCLGVCDLIEEGKNGLQASGIDDAASLAKTLRVLMADDQRREDMGKQAVKTMEAYKPEIIFDKWEKFFKEAAK